MSPAPHPEGLIYSIELWADDRPYKMTARASSIVVARKALDAAIEEYAGAKILLCHGGRIIDGTEQRERNRVR